MSGIGRASVLIGAGTIVSRLTGFLRAVVLVAAVGSVGSRAGDAFSTANQLPNNIYAIISTGLLTAVIVPQIVKASSHQDGGRAFISKVFTLGTVVLLATTLLATLAAPWLVQLYAPDYTPEQLALTTTFAYWCLPQIFFYGLYALVGEALNARRVYGPFTWAPIVNNVVSIAGFVGFILLFGGPVTDPVGWTPDMIALLAGTATLGIIVQAAILLFFWRRTGLHVRPDFRWRGVGLNHIAKLAGWTFLMVVAGQLAGLVQSRVLSPASGEGPAAAASANAWLLFMLPYSIIVLSIGTPYFTQLSEHASAGRDDDVRADIGRSIRTLGVFIVIAAFALAAAAVPASRIFTNSASEAVAAAWVLLAFLVGLIPLAVLFVIQRSFYAYNDTRTPFFFTLVQCAIVVATALVAQALLTADFLAAGVALGQSLASIVQVILATWLLQRRLGSLAIGSWMLSLARFVLAAVPAAAAGWAVFLWFGGADGWTASTPLLGALGAAVIGTVAIAVYVGFLALLRAPELSVAMGLVRRFLPGRR
ncbi:murein biosynthesis integral membrane protein MurJ [Microbacterium sp. B35-04]|uniref:murein biosynthesis integral membrane protein MurJ n=1 Tax=unclassified Microbacterium TaxID=2609290 RepID=UPI0013D22FF7|nr:MULTISPECIES: murein biosynthesis integral membrane protein MurJ [unclassified Microbacterium]KAF2412304.1 murein biosynthesis integral membrane protein MurJ [Microbacterium sp. B35-04]KAF2420434.1 murein biosynthesis integral membrane protein MurJ [Microbacterium sp. B35-30]